MSRGFLLISVLTALLFGLVAHADDADSSTSSGGDEAPAEAPAKPAVKKKGTKRASEKETEGTEAADRFQADTVIKSQYRVNGQQLEVDPD
jgi:hypothetical protein